MSGRLLAGLSRKGLDIMAVKRSGFDVFRACYGFAAKALKENPRIFWPFLIFAGLELVSLIGLYLVPRDPLRAVLGPVVSTFWGDQFLHYPQNFFLLPKLAGFSRMVLAGFIGSLLTGIAVAFLYRKPMAAALRKYAHLMVVTFLIIFVYYFTNRQIHIFMVKYFSAGHKHLLFMAPALWLGPLTVVISQLLALVVQALLLYAVPALILTDVKFPGAIWKSVVLFFRHPFITLALVGFPMAVGLPLIFVNYNSPFLMAMLVPEVVLWAAVRGVGINSRVIDPLVTLTTAAFFLEKEGKK